MLKRNHTPLYAGAAIAAALAFSPTSRLAQAVEAPVAPAPQPVMAPEAPPTTVMTSSPVVQQTPTEVVAPAENAPPSEPAAAAAAIARTPTTTTRTPAIRRSGPASPAPVDAPADSAPAAATDTSEPPVAPPAAEIEPLAAAAPVAEPVEPTVGEDSTDTLLAALLGGLAVLALAIWGFVAIGRRKPADRQAAENIERPVVPAVAAAAAPEAIVAEPPAAAPSVSPIRTVTPAPSMMHSGASVPLPRTMPESFEERDALIKRMVAAKPDRANPFTDYKARLKRARLIVQSLGRDFGDTEPWIDLSQYPQNWPELAHRRHAAA